MKRVLTKGVMAAIVAIAMLTVFCTTSAQAIEITWPDPNWLEVFEPNQLLTLNLTMDPCDWLYICADGYLDGDENDVDYELEVPAMLWRGGEEGLKIKVAVRQKSCDPIPLPGYTLPDPIDVNNIDPNKIKISLKIDINQYYPEDPCAATEWHGLKKLSLENGDDTNVLSEGASCNIHQMASDPKGYGYDAWRASWVKLYVNGVYRGVYINNEQHDKQFMRNRGLYIHGETWLYKYWGDGDIELKVGDDLNPQSPALPELCYNPFACDRVGSPLYPPGGVCPAPNEANLVADMNQWVNMQGLLTMAATNAFMANPDSLFSHYNNAYFLDFNLPDPCETRKRMYFPWDVDSIPSVMYEMAVSSVDYDIYERAGGATTWQQLILGSPTFRAQYNQIMKDLLNGPLSFADVNDLLDTVEPVLTSAVATDLWNQLPTSGEPGVAEYFSYMREWYSHRIANVLAQVDFDENVMPLGIVLLDDGFESTPWDADWNDVPHNWVVDASTYAYSSPSARAKRNNDGYFYSDALDANDATAIHIDFWFMRDDTAAGDFKLYYYNGSTYVEVADLTAALGGDDSWLHYTDTITDSQYFIPDFKIRFYANMDKSQKNVWVDNVVVTKLIPDLDRINPINFKDFAILANDWRLTGPNLVGDITGDEVVDFKDLDKIVEYWLSDYIQP